MLGCGRIGFDGQGDSGVAEPIDAGVSADAAPSTPQLIGTGGHPYRIASDGSDVYWSDFSNGAVYKVPVAGGESTVLLPPEEGVVVYGLTLGGGFLYVCDQASGLIRRVSTATGTSTEMVTSPCFDVAVDDTHLYWSSNDPLTPTVRRLALPDGATEELGALGNAGNLVVHDGMLVWTAYSIGEVRAMPTSGGQSTLLAATDERGPWGLTVDGGYVYWVNHHQDSGGVMRVSLAGGISETLVADQAGAHQIKVYDGDVYWTNEYAGTIARRTSDGTIETIASGQVEPMGLVITDEAYFWTTEGGTVMRLAR